jgi:hypothetical protein
LALQLGKTVGQLTNEMSWSEYQGWVLYFAEQNKEPEPLDLTQMSESQIAKLFG